MTDFIQVPIDSTGEKVAVTQLPDGLGNNVDRQEIIPSDPTDYNGKARVKNVEPASTDYGSVVRLAVVGSSVYHAVSVAGLNAATIKGSAGRVTGWHIFNNAAYDVFVKLFDETTVPVPGTDTVKYTIKVPSGQDAVPLSDVSGIAFGTGIGIAITMQAADADATSIAVGDCVVNIHTK